MKKFLYSIPEFIETKGGVFFLGLLFLSLFLQVVLRYVFNNPSPELFEIGQYAFIWTIFLGAPYARKFDAHIKFDIIYSKLPPRAKLVLQIVFDVFFSVVLLVTFIPVFKDVLFYKIIKSEVLRIPWTYLFMCFPIFMILMFTHNTIWIVRNVMELVTGKKFKREVEPWV